MNLLIGYFSEEEKVAAGLKAWVELAFGGQCSAVLSGDEPNLPGSKWFEEIDHALDVSKAVLIICSPRSIQKPLTKGVRPLLSKVLGIREFVLALTDTGYGDILYIQCIDKEHHHD